MRNYEECILIEFKPVVDGGRPLRTWHNHASLCGTCTTTRPQDHLAYSASTLCLLHASEYPPSHHMLQSTYRIRDYGSTVCLFLEPSVWTLESKMWPGLGWAIGGPRQGLLIFTPEHYGLEWTQIRLLGGTVNSHLHHKTFCQTIHLIPAKVSAG